MSDTYTKLFRSIAASTIVSEPLATRWLWVTMLSQADKAGKVYASVPGLARMANITLAECEAGLQCFLSPDAYSRTADNEGRRIEAFDGGWRLLNHGKYDAMRNEAERREKKREWDRQNRPSGHQRAKAAGSDSQDGTRQSDSSPPQSDETRQSGPISHISSLKEQEQGAQKPARQPRGKRFSEWIVSLDGEMAVPADDPVYRWGDQTGIPDDFLELAWLAFEDRYRQEPKRYDDWRKVFRNAVKGNWMKVWYATPDGSYALTTVGETWRRATASRRAG